MATKFSKLTVVLGSNVKGFDKGMKNAQKGMRDTSAVSKKLSSTFKAVGAAILAAFAFRAVLARVRGFVSGIENAMQRLDEVGKTAARIGLGTEQLLAYQLAAQKAGLESGVFTKSMERMIANVQEASTGTGEAKDSLELLGVDIEKLNTLAPDAQMRVLADALSGVSNQADRVAIAMDIFGGRGVKMLNLLQNGSESLDEAADRAKQLGLNISNIQVAQIEAANDAVTDLKALFGSATRAVAVALSPAITALANKITGVGDRTKDTFNTIRLVVRSIMESVIDLTSIWDKFNVIAAKTALMLAGIGVGSIQEAARNLADALEQDTPAAIRKALDKARKDAADRNFGSNAPHPVTPKVLPPKYIPGSENLSKIMGKVFQQFNPELVGKFGISRREQEVKDKRTHELLEKALDAIMRQGSGQATATR